MERLESTYQNFITLNSSAIFGTRFHVLSADLNKRLVRSLLERDKASAIKLLDEMTHMIVSTFGPEKSLEEIKTYWTGLVAFIYHSHSLTVNYIDPLMMAKTSALTHTVQTYNSLNFLLGVVPWFIDRTFELEHSLNNDSNLVLAIDFINENLSGDLNLFKVANHVNLSPQYLNSAFKSNLGISFKDYVREKRLYRFCQDLTFSVLSISEIAKKYGYSHQSYYSKHFKDLFGVTPLQYRKGIITHCE